MSAATFSPTPPETALVNQIFNLFDPQKFGILTGDVAVKVFSGAKLPPTVLGEIWNIADEDNKGWLPKRGVSVAIRLIGWAQKGERVSKDLVARPGPIPNIEGITAVTRQNTGRALPKSPPPISFPSLTPQDRAKFHSLFHKAGPQNGLISGEKARALFLKSRLSNDQLLQIWNLADTQDRGALDATDFTIGMYFIQAAMSRQLSVIPLSLPPGLYQQAAGNSTITASHISTNSGSFSPVSSSFTQQKVQPQFTGQNVLQPNYTGATLSPKVSQSPLAKFGSSSLPGVSPFPPPAALAQWDVSAIEKANADNFFDELDMHKRGYIEGDVAVPFMLKSNLPGEDLARVWDLADLDNNGRLTRDGFAIAMHLIQKRLSGQDLPAILPPSLIPPSMPNNPATSFTFSPPSHSRHAEPMNDLFSFEETSATPSIPSQTPEATVILQPQQTGQKLSTFPPQPASRGTTSDPFSPFPSVQHRDLLGDDDDDGKPSSPLQDKSAEIGNAKNQLNSTNRSLEAAKNERVSQEQLLADQATQLATLQAQLSSAKAAYDAETKSLANLKERQTNQLSEIQKFREELIHAESNLSAVRVEKAEIEGTFLRDKEEVRELHRKMVEVGQETENLRYELEKVKKEAKQQRGLLAIARKQLSTKEGEKAKIEKELGEAADEIASIGAEREYAEIELAKSATPSPMFATPERGLSSDSAIFAAQYPLPSTPEIQNTGPGRSNNPFERFNVAPLSSDFSSGADLNGMARAIASTTSMSFENAFITEASPKQGTDDPAQRWTATNGTIESNMNTPKPQPIDLQLLSPSQSEDFLSPAPDSELFVTPPTSSTVRSQASSPPLSFTATQPAARATPLKSPTAEDAQPSQTIEATAVPYPPIDDFGSQFPSVESPGFPGSFPKDQENEQQKPQAGHIETDLNAELKELDADETDSDSEEEIPLAELTKEKNKANATSGNKQSQDSKAFDDIFGVAQPATAESANGALRSGFDPHILSMLNASAGEPASPFDVPKTGPSRNATVTQLSTNNSGISAFDEALEKIPTLREIDSSNPASDNNQFTFQAAFDDNFDFASANASGAAAPSTIPLSISDARTSDVDGSIPVGPAGDSFSFLPPQTSQTAAPDVSGSFSFEEAFSGLNMSPPTSQARTQPEAVIDAEATSKPSAPSIPTSPQDHSSSRISNGSQGTSFRSSSPTPQKTRSPKRVPSPKPRPSISKEEKHGNIPVRHSKLSLRLPFGKKRKQQQEVQPAPAPPVQHLSPPREPSAGDEDDVQSVKQLLSMGFSRTQAVEALERNGYDFQRALNTLLGTQ